MFKGLILLLAAVDALSHVDGWDDLNKQVCKISIPYPQCNLGKYANLIESCF